MGWSKTHPIYLYTDLPIMFFAVFTYTAIGYALFCIFSISRNSQDLVTFDPMDPLHLILVSSKLGAQCSLVEHLPDSGDPRIEDYEKLHVKVTKDGPASIGFIVHGSNHAPSAEDTELDAKDKSHV
ncbi:hypothetical protein V8E55_009126 [Tylopilus felleus]